MDKSLILNEIKKHLNIKKETEFAEFLGINQSTLSNWHKRGTLQYETIISKCEDIDANWLLTGEGEMLKKSVHEEDNYFVNESNPEKYESCPNNKDKEIAHLENENRMQKDIIEGLKRENELLRTILYGSENKKRSV